MRSTALRMQHKVIQEGGVDARYSCFSWTVEGIDNDDIYSHKWNPPKEVRAAAYRLHSTQLAIEVGKKAISNWGGSPDNITHVIGVTTTGWDEPGLASKLIENLKLSPFTEKFELVFNGCFAGVTGLRVAKSLFQANPKAAILVVAVEVPTVHCNATSFDKSRVLGNLLFGDGAGGVVISDKGSWSMKDFGNYKIPGSARTLLMHESTTPDHGGFEMTLSKDLASNLKAAFTGTFGLTLLQKIISHCGMVKRPAFCVQPGGKRILSNVSQAVASLHLGTLPRENFDTMGEYGNMATVSIFAVLEQYLPKAEHDSVCLLAFGPGVTIEYGFLKRVSPLSKPTHKT